ncbi:MAG: acetate/propionate family kinase [Fusobacteriota bacterium]
MNILVINSGSSSLKYQLFDIEEENVLAKGVVERIGLKESVLTHEAKNDENEITKDIPNHKVALELVIDQLVNKELSVLKSIKNIDAVGHRVVHGGENFSESVIVNNEVLKAIEDCESLAPLHNPANKGGILACQEMMPDTPQIAVFDTAFHQTMEPSSYLYAIPYKYYEKYGIRGYGFHGTSHKYVAYETANYLDENIKDLKTITCHIGNGASIAAIDGGKVIDTSMGFTPLEGLVMGSRCGDLDPAIVSFLMKKEDLSSDEVDHILNKESGILGISGVSSDMRDVLKAAHEGNGRAQLAVDIFIKRIVKYIGAYVAELNGVDAIVFTAGIGENSIPIRKGVIENLGWLGIELDDKQNQKRGKKLTLSTKDSDTKVLVIPTNEEYMIAKDTYNLVK